MDGQQVFVTGADGEQMVLSGPEAAALLAQAGISLGDGQDQVMAGGEGAAAAGEQEGAPAAAEQTGAAAVQEGGNILVPEGSTVAEDGSIIAADGTVLAPAGTVMIGEDGTLMMAETSALLSQDQGALATDNAANTGTAPTEFTTPDGATFKAGEGGILTDADGNVLTDEAGNFLTTADLGALGVTSTATDTAVTSSAPTMATSDTAPAPAQENNFISDGNFLRTADGNLLTDEEGNFLAPDGNIIKPEDAHKILANMNLVADNGAAPADTENNDAPAATSEEAPSQVTDNNVPETEAAPDAVPAPAVEESAAEPAVPEVPVVTEDESEPPLLEVRSKNDIEKDEAIAAAVAAVNKDDENNALALEPEKSKTETVDAVAAPVVSDALGNMPILEGDTDTSLAPAVVDTLPVVSEAAPAVVSTAVSMETTDILSAATSAAVVSADPAVTMASVSVPVELSLPSSSDGGIYTTADGRVLSLPEGIITNATGHLINPADGSILTTEDGTPLMLPEGAILAPATTQAAAGAAVTSGGITSGGIMVSSESDIMSVCPPVSLPAAVQSSAGPTQLISSTADGTMIAPEGSMIATDGSILAADGTMLAPPGSVSLTPEPPTPQQPLNAPIPANLAPTQPQNLIGLQLPESGEVLYLDPNDPSAQQLLQEAGIHLGDNGVLQTLDGQVLQGEDGNPITTNTKPQRLSPTKHNNIVSGALAAAGLVDTSDIDMPLNANQSVNTNIIPNLPTQPVSYNQLTANNDDAIRQHLSQLQPRYTPPAQQQKQQQQTQYKKLTFNSGASNYTSPAPAPIQKRQIAPKRRSVPNTDLQIGPDQQKVTYTVTSENGYTQTYMMICSKSLDQNTLINTLIKNISSDPNHKGKKTIKITQHKYGAKKTTKTPQRVQQRQTPSQRQVNSTPNQRTVQQRIAPQQRVVQQVQYKPMASASASPAVKQQSPLKPPQQLLEADQDMGDFTNNMSLDDLMKQVVDQTGSTDTDKDPKVIVRCNYCTNFKCVLNSQTWENILNHILPVAKEELHCSFYGNILKHFARSLRVSVTGGREQCEVVVSHGLVCRRTGSWYSVEKPGVELATTLASHIAAVQPGVSGPYGARPRGNSLLCLFCSSPYTAEDYQRHLKPHQDFIVPCLLLAAGAYCATSFELEVRKASQQGETQDLRFPPCTKFAMDFNCGRLQATVDTFRENFDSRGFLQVANSAMTKCSVCRTPTNTYCALFKLNAATAKIFGCSGEEMLSVCANCQKQFVNVVMRENSFEKQLKMFQLHHMEQLCGMLRVLLSASQAICSKSYNLLYSVQEGGSLYNASNTLHTVVPARIIMNPVSKIQKLEEDKTQELSGPSMKYCCDNCKFSIDLTRLQHSSGSKAAHLVDMAVGVVLEHIVPHTESLMSVITTAAFNEVFRLKFEFTASVEGEGVNKKIIIGLDRKIVAVDTGAEVLIQKDVQKTIDMLKTKLKQDKKGNVTIKKKHLFLDNPSTEQADAGQTMEVGKFLDAAANVLQLYGCSGCNTKLLDFYAECRLCSKFSFPDFRLTAAIKNKDGVALCENCCETILSLCVPSEPEKVAGKGEMCLLLGVEKTVGHRLVLSNNTKKWISSEGVAKIQAVNEICSTQQLPDYSTNMVQLLKSHLQAVSERAWSDSSCMTARAGFCVLNPEVNKQSPIEVKVTIKPPKPKTSPTKLVITPVNANSKSPTANTRLVKITANRRIIPVRDPTSISTPPRMATAAEKAKIAASIKASGGATKLASKLPPNTSVTSSPPTNDAKEEEIDSDLEKEDDFESIDAIANFISSSEPPPPKKVKGGEKASNEVTDALTDEFTDSSLSTPKSGKNNGTATKTPESLSKLPKGTVVTTNVETPDTKKDDEDKTSTAAPAPVSNGDVSDVKEENGETEIKLPPGLVISPAGVQDDKDSQETKPDQELSNNLEVETPKTEIVPSLASDATTSTKDTVTPARGTRSSKVVTKNGADDDTEVSPKDEKTSTVNNAVSKASDNNVTVNNGKTTRQSKQRDSDNSDNGNDAESLTSLDMENDDLEDDEEDSEEVGGKKSGVKLSAILPKPSKSRNSTPASSSKRGVQSKTPVAAVKAGDKRKRSESPAPASKGNKKTKLSEDEAPSTPDQAGSDLISGTSSSGRVRRQRKMFDL